MIDVARTISRRAEVKQLQHWSVFITVKFQSKDLCNADHTLSAKFEASSAAFAINLDVTIRFIRKLLSR